MSEDNKLSFIDAVSLATQLRIILEMIREDDEDEEVRAYADYLLKGNRHVKQK